MEKFKLPEDLMEQMTNEFEQIRQSDCELNLELPLHLQIVQFTKEISFFVAIRIGFQNNNMTNFSSNVLERIQNFGRNSSVHRPTPSLFNLTVPLPYPYRTLTAALPSLSLQLSLQKL